MLDCTIQSSLQVTSVIDGGITLASDKANIMTGSCVNVEIGITVYLHDPE